jgi:hypothetical protein
VPTANYSIVQAMSGRINAEKVIDNGANPCYNVLANIAAHSARPAVPISNAYSLVFPEK